MIPITTVVGSSFGSAFGRVADRINLLKPNVLTWPSASSATTQTEIAANHINQWEPGDPTQIPYPNNYTGDDFVSFGAAVAAPDKSLTAYPIVEVEDDVVPAYAAKPSPWTLTGYHSSWSDFWTNARCVVPCWEGTGSPSYYVAGGVAGTTLTSVGSPTWGTVDGSSLHFSAGVNDWRIEAVTGTDIFPTTSGTFLMVRKVTGSPSSNDANFGIIGDVGAGNMRFFPFGANTVVGAWGNVTQIVSDTWAASTDIEIIALVIGTGGHSLYRRLGSSILQGELKNSHGITAFRTAGNYQFGLAMGYTASATVAQDVLFFAALNDEWTANEVKIWMNDPYAPIRTDGGSPALHEGRASPHYVQAGAPHCSGSIVAAPLPAIRYEFRTYAKAGTRTRFKLEISGNSSISLGARMAGVTTIFDLAGGQVAVAPAAFGTGTFGGELVEWTPGDATITAVGGGWYRCTLEVLSNAGGSFTKGGVICVITTDAGSGLEAEDTTFAAAGGDTIYFWQTRLLPEGAFELNNRQFFDGFDTNDTIDLDHTMVDGFNWYTKYYYPSSYLFSDYVLDPAESPAETFSVADSILSFVGAGGPFTQLGIVSMYWDGTGSADATGQFPFSTAHGAFFQPPAFFEIKARWPNVPSAVAPGPPVFWVMPAEALMQLDWYNADTTDSFYTSSSLNTNATTAIGNNVLHFSYVPLYFRKPGILIYDESAAIPSITRVVSATTTSITLDKNIVSPGIASSAPIHAGWYIEHDFYENTGWNVTNPAVDHTPYSTMIDLPGYWNATNAAGTPNDTEDFHLYQTLWLPVTTTQHGIVMNFKDGIFVDDIVAGYPRGNTKIYDLDIKGDGVHMGAFTMADSTDFHYVLLVGGGSDDWLYEVDHVAVYGE